MLPSILLILLGIVLLYGGAEFLVRGSASIARRMGLSPLVIGLTIVALGTSMPEMVVSLQAAFAGSESIAIGNVVGSNIGNIALILGITALVSPPSVHARVLRVDLPLLVGVTVIFAFLLRDHALSRGEGLLLMAGLASYILINLRLARDESSEIAAEYAEGVPDVTGSVARDTVSVLGGFGLLVAGAQALVDGAVVVAGACGLSEATIGLTVVALGTSLPELATSVVAAARNEGDIAIGNVLGSNLFNILAIAGSASVIHPLAAADLSRIDVVVMVLLAVVLLPLMHTGERVERGEGAVLLGSYVLYIAYLLNAFA
jgi:cation:H+ antiporter